MPVQKQPIEMLFGQGLDTKTDPKKVQLGKFLKLENTIFQKGGLLQKRNGFANLPSPSQSPKYLTTFNGNLTAIGTSLEAYAQSSSQWVNKGAIQPVGLTTLSLVRSNTNQSQCDSAVSSNGLVCTAYTDVGPSSTTYKYVVAEADTGQNVIAPTVITNAAAGFGSPRVFALGRYFIILYTSNTGGPYHLQYIAIDMSILSVNSPVDLTTAYTPSSTVAFDGIVANNSLYVAWNANTGGGAIKLTQLTSTLVQGSTVTFAGRVATMISVTADLTQTTPVIWAVFYDFASTSGYALSVNQALSTILAPTLIIAAGTVLNITSVAQNSLMTFFYEQVNGNGTGNFITVNTLTQAGVLGTSSVCSQALGLGSKAFLYSGVSYLLGAFNQGTIAGFFQPSYFLINGSGNVIAKLAYSNGGGYLTTGLPSVTFTGNVAQIGYLIQDLIQSVNKSQGATNPTGVYSQLGVNLAFFDMAPSAISTAEIGQNLATSGGFMWAYDGFQAVEQNFHYWPSTSVFSLFLTGGGLSKQIYYYYATYEWSDNQGNVFRSAPSVPQKADFTALTATPLTFQAVFSAASKVLTVSSVTGLHVGQIITDSTTPGNLAANTKITTIINSTHIAIDKFPLGTSAVSPGDTLSTSDTFSAEFIVLALKLTYKTVNPVKIVIYRWSTANPIPYQVTLITSPLLNPDPKANGFIDYVDASNDAEILGNNILYTTGGVVENIGPPPTSAMTIFDDRLWALDSENDLLWFSKQVIQGTPVEMSDLFTFFVPPNIASGPTGPVKCIGVMDDKFVLFHRNILQYFVGQGPDNTGANNQYSQPVIIQSPVGCSNQASIVLTPLGLMFQSENGIWLIQRNLGVSYVGAPVEAYNSAKVLSSTLIPSTTQVRFILDSGVTLMYDYFYDQWGAFNGVSGISSTIYQNLHTLLRNSQNVRQETPGLYLDGASPVLMSFQSAWIKLQGLQGYQRAFFFYLLGQFLSPHKLSLSIAYDYNLTPEQVTLVTPNNYGGVYGGGGTSTPGSNPPYGSDEFYGGTETDVEQERIFLDRQRCQAFQITLQEIFDSSFGTTPGAGFTLSGLNLIAGFKRGFPTISAAKSSG